MNKTVKITLIIVGSLVAIGIVIGLVSVSKVKEIVEETDESSIDLKRSKVVIEEVEEDKEQSIEFEEETIVVKASPFSENLDDYEAYINDGCPELIEDAEDTFALLAQISQLKEDDPDAQRFVKLYEREQEEC